MGFSRKTSCKHSISLSLNFTARFSQLRYVKLYATMEDQNTRYESESSNRFITFAIVFFSSSNSLRMIDIIAMFNSLTFMNLLRLLIVIAIFDSCNNKNFLQCF